MKNISKSTGYLVVTAFWLAICLLWSTKTQAQINICDSIELSVSPTSTWWVATIETNLTPNNFPISYVQSYNWTSCLMCGTNVGTDTSSIISFFTDTTEMYAICLTSVFCDSNLCYTCVTCDTLVWDNGNWEMMSIVGNSNSGLTLSINELTPSTINDGTMYDMLGREVTDVALGTMYIRNNKKYIRIK